jgi:chromosome partition protein MukE
MNPSDAGKLLDMVQHPMFPAVDQLLRCGGHLDEDDFDQHAFVHESEDILGMFYQRYGADLRQTQEGSYFLIAKDNPLFKHLTLSRLDMIIGKTLGKVSLAKLLSTLELHPGRASLLIMANIRVADEEAGNKRLREAIGRSLHLLDELRFVVWDGRAEQVIPRKAAMRFADDVRAAGTLQENLAGQIEIGAALIGRTQLDPDEHDASNAPPDDASDRDDREA